MSFLYFASGLALTLFINEQIKTSMEDIYIEDKTYKDQDFDDKKLKKGEYENCTFLNCRFANTDLTEIKFTECLFENCDLTMLTATKTANVAFRDAQFKGCKLIGFPFEHCNPFLFSVSFQDCLLNLATFNELKMPNTVFNNCELEEVDFTNTDLSKAIFTNCNFDKTIFENTNLEKANFKTSYNYSIDPEKNNIKKAKFSLDGLAGLLDKYDIEVN